MWDDRWYTVHEVRIMNQFAETLRYHRLRRGLTQVQLADKLDVRYQTVSKWETAATLPDTAMLPQLADALGVSVDDLFARSNRSCTGQIPADDRDFLLGVYAQMYGPEAGPWNLSVGNRYLEYRIADFFEKHFDVDAGMEICNIGIGAGEWDRYLSYRLQGGGLTSIDQLEICCSQLEKRLVCEGNPNPVRVICADAMELDLTERFDLLTMVGTTGQESGDSVKLLGQAVRFLRPGGQLYYQSLDEKECADTVLRAAFSMGLQLIAFEEDMSHGFTARYFRFDKA